MLSERDVRNSPDVSCGRPGCSCSTSNGNIHCPHPNHLDTKPSFSVATGNKGNLIMHCFSGCDSAEIWKALVPYTPQVSTNNWNQETIKKRPSARMSQLVEAKELHTVPLEKLGISDSLYYGNPCIAFKYFDTELNTIATRLRIAIDGDDKFRWEKSGKDVASRAALYGQQFQSDAIEIGEASLCEGETDVLSILDAFHYDESIKDRHYAFGLPGVSIWDEEYLSEFFKEIPVIYAWVEPDTGGTTLINHIRHSSIRGKIKLVFLNDCEDINDVLKASAWEYFVEPSKVIREEYLANAIDWRDYLRMEAMMRRIMPRPQEQSDTVKSKGADFDVTSLKSWSRDTD